MTPRIYAPPGSALVPCHSAGGRPAIRIGIVTDDQGLDSEHDALVRHAPDYLQPREYRLSASGLCSEHRLGLHQLQVLLREDDVDAIHLASPRLAGLWTRWLSVRLGLPLISTYHGAPGDNAVDRWPRCAASPGGTTNRGSTGGAQEWQSPLNAGASTCCVKGGPANAWSWPQPELIPTPSHPPSARRP